MPDSPAGWEELFEKHGKAVLILKRTIQLPQQEGVVLLRLVMAQKFYTMLEIAEVESDWVEIFNGVREKEEEKLRNQIRKVLSNLRKKLQEAFGIPDERRKDIILTRKSGRDFTWKINWDLLQSPDYTILNEGQ